MPRIYLAQTTPLMHLLLKGHRLKRAALALCLAPVFAYGQIQEWTSTSVNVCYEGKTSKSEVMNAIQCLKANPAAGSAVTARFRQEQAALISADADVAAAFADLELQKGKRLYVEMRRINGGPVLLMVVEAATVAGASHSTLYDLGAIDLSFTHTSSIFGSDKVVPLQTVSSFRYVPTGDGIGEMKSDFTDGTSITDKSYQAGYPVRIPQAGKKGYAIEEFTGIVYPKKVFEHWRLDLNGLSRYIVKFLPEEEGKNAVAKREDALAAQREVTERLNRAAAETRRIRDEQEAKSKLKALAEMSKAARGSEDSCRRISSFAAIEDPTSTGIECQFSGRINLDDLKSVGWLVVNKQRDSDNIVREYYIRKVR